MKAKALAIKAALGTALAAAAVLAPQADAATVKTTTASCAAGTFKGNVNLNYETTGGHHAPISATVASGPYIGDSGQLTLSIYYVEGDVTTNVYRRIWRGTIPAKIIQSISGVATPDTAKSYVSAAFTGGSGALCTARAEIK